ncbi:MAG TPA: hypothetical protein ENI10_16820 [Halomonas sp.]|nr:hypothetical protein [Halomonas sp.]HDZ46400.1 hypothetical protein [Halomonas sp.]HEB06226.1 hypothetical protein [Halomonas sp.]
MSKSIWVNADWLAKQPPELVGRLEVDLIWGSEVYRFAYASTNPATSWVNTIRSASAGCVLSCKKTAFFSITICNLLRHHFQLSPGEARIILDQLQKVTRQWHHYANEIGIHRQEQQLIASAIM